MVHKYLRGGRRIQWLFFAIVFILLQLVPLATLTNTTKAANPAANLDQWANLDDEWVNGNLGSSKAQLREGDSVAYRMRMTDLTISSHALTIAWDTTKGGDHALDYLTSFNKTFNPNPCSGVSGCSSYGTYDIPQDSNIPFSQFPGQFRLYGGTITSISSYMISGSYSGDSTTSITINFNASVANPVLAWGGHIASQINWGYGESASAISGSPYHTRLVDLDGAGGNQDRSLSADAVFPTPNMSTQASKSQLFLGESVTDSVTVSKIDERAETPTGTVNFYICGPDTTIPECSSGGTSVGSVKTLSSGSANSDSFTPNGLGKYCFRAEYTPYASSPYSPQSHTNQTTECFTVVQVPNGNLTIVKIVNNKYGGSANASDFKIKVMQDGTDVTGSPSEGSESGTTYSLSPGTYSVGEEALPAGYKQDSIICDNKQNTSVTITSNSSHTCIITNSDIAPKLIVKKHVVNDNGGTKSANDFEMSVSASEPNPSAFNGDENGTTVTLNAGSYIVEETANSGYKKSYSGDCSSTGGGTINIGETKTCTITNDDIAPSLSLIKKLIKDNGGNASEDDWTLTASGLTPVSGKSGVTSGATFKAGTYTLNESSGPDGYTSKGWSCTNGVNVVSGQITLSNGQTTSCTITNDDDAPALTLLKDLVNTYNDNAEESDWLLNANGPSIVSGYGEVEDNNINAGSYDLSESSSVWNDTTYYSSDWKCDGGTLVGTVLSVALGQKVTCKIKNTMKPATLIVKKEVVNDDGGTAKATDFTFKLNGVMSGSFDQTTSDSKLGEKTLELPAGTYSILEDQSNQNGYETYYSSDCNDAVIANGETKTCTITNDDIAPSLTLHKTVKNDNGGNKTASDFTPKVDSIDKQWSVKYQLKANQKYTASETQQPGYSASDWSGGCNSNGEITLALGEDADCYITNDDNSAALTLIKKLGEKYGSSAKESDWLLSASGPTNFSGNGTVTKSVDAGSYDLSESVITGWESAGWDCGEYGSSINGLIKLNLKLGDEATCTVTNNAIQPKLKVIKHVVNEYGQTKEADDFTINVRGTNVSDSIFQGDKNGTTVTLDEGKYYVYEDKHDGYKTTYSEDCGSYDNQAHIKVGDVKTCTITNAPIRPKLTLVKIISGDQYGDDATENDFGLYVDDKEVKSGETYSYDIGYHYIGETGLYGYRFVNISGNEDCEYNSYLTRNNEYDCEGEYESKCPTDLDSEIYLDAGDEVTCYITNSATQPTLTIKKVVINDNGGTKLASDFNLYVNGDQVQSGQIKGYDIGEYTISESQEASYTSSFSDDCDANGKVFLDLAEDKVCTIINNDVAPSLKLVKNVINDNGGSAKAADWVLTAMGPTNITDNGEVSSNIDFKAGTYVLSESTLSGYTSKGWACTNGVTVSNNQISLSLGQSTVCTVTNDDNAPLLVNTGQDSLRVILLSIVLTMISVSGVYMLARPVKIKS